MKSIKSVKYALVLIFVILLGLLINNFGITQIIGNSMYSTYSAGQFVFIDKRISTRTNISHNDIIVFAKQYTGSNSEYIKRVVAISGDTISSCNGEVIVNGNPLKGCHYESDVSYTLKEDEFFVIGDNYNSSIDSRTFGIITTTEIKGKVI